MNDGTKAILTQAFSSSDDDHLKSTGATAMKYKALGVDVPSSNASVKSSSNKSLAKAAGDVSSSVGAAAEHQEATNSADNKTKEVVICCESSYPFVIFKI